MGGCGYVFGRCASGETLHDADISVPLVGLEDNVGLVYLATVDPKTGEVDGSIVRMDNEDVYAYEGPNMVNPSDFTDFRIAEEQGYALADARDFSIGEYSVFDIVPWPLDPSQEMTPEFVQEAFAGNHDVVDSFRYLVQELADERSEIYEQLRSQGIDPQATFNGDNDRHMDNLETFGMRTFAEGKLAEAEAILDRLERADALGAIGSDLSAQIEANETIQPEQKEVLREEMTLGAMDGPGATEPLYNNDFNQP